MKMSLITTSAIKRKAYRSITKVVSKAAKVVIEGRYPEPKSGIPL